jgi:hypothetical protein
MVSPWFQIIRTHLHSFSSEFSGSKDEFSDKLLGTQERDVHAGAIVFIPSDTWITVKNTGNETINLAFVFSDPGFDEFMRCTSVPAGESSSTRVTHEEFKDCQHKGHVVYEGSDPAISH